MSPKTNLEHQKNNFETTNIMIQQKERVYIDEEIGRQYFQKLKEMLNNENDLYFLVQSFPEKCEKYLEKGNQDQNSNIVDTFMKVCFDKQSASQLQSTKNTYKSQNIRQINHYAQKYHVFIIQGSSFTMATKTYLLMATIIK